METEIAAPEFGYVESLLVTARDLAQRLAQVLELERVALVTRDMEGLRSLLQEKDQLITLLGRVEDSHATPGAGYSQTGASVQSHFSAAQRERLALIQDELRCQLSACRDQNHVNGRLVQRARQSVAEVLQVITGSAPAQMYTASGAAESGSDGRTIAKA